MNSRRQTVFFVMSVAVFSLGTAAVMTLALGDWRVGKSPVSYTPHPRLTNTPLPSPVPLLIPSAVLVPTATLRPLPAPSFTPLPSPTPTVTPSPTPKEVFYSAGSVVEVPILLYHHVVDGLSEGRFQVSAMDFRQQMAYLRAQGYQAIPLSRLVDVLLHGGTLPEQAVVVTFDDGYADVYTQAFSILQEMGMTGTVFVVAGRLDYKGFLTSEQVVTLHRAGWDVGSHTMTHLDLTQHHDRVREEVLDSRLRLGNLLGEPIRLFAYPFALSDPYVQRRVYDLGYYAAVGVGTTNRHGPGNLYYLSRREVRGDMTMEEFIGLLK